MATEATGCYCGCETKRNKILWAVSGVLGGIAVLCIIISVVLHNSCARTLLFAGCGGSAAFFWIFILFVIGSTIPCYMMCCCSTPPEDESKIAKAGVPLQSTYVQAPVVAPPAPQPGVPVHMPPPPPPAEAVVPGVQAQPAPPPPPPAPKM